MKKIPSFLLVFIAFTAIAFSQARVVKVLDAHWKFQKGNFEDAFKANFNDSKWESVTVPHDWAIYGSFDKKVLRLKYLFAKLYKSPTIYLHRIFLMR